MPKKELLRIVRTPEGQVLLDDPKGKTNGRGCYVCPQVPCFEKAIKKKAFSHVLKVKIPSENMEQVKDAFIARLMQIGQ